MYDEAQYPIIFYNAFLQLVEAQLILNYKLPLNIIYLFIDYSADYFLH